MKKVWVVYLLICFTSFLFGQKNTLIMDKDGVLMKDEIKTCPNTPIRLKLRVENSTTDSYLAEVKAMPIVTNGVKIPIEIHKQGNNHFSRTITLPFPFKFYGKTYQHMVIGSNGRVIFGAKNDIDKLYDNEDKVDTNKKLPNEFYNKLDKTQPNIPLNIAQIFLGFTDLGYYNTNDYHNIKCEEVSYNNKKGIRVSFTNISLLNSNYNRNITSEVLFFEDNSFFIKVIKRQPHEKALIGIQNEDATKSETFKEDYNNENWISNTNDAISFSPNGIPLSTNIEWFLDDVKQSSWEQQQEIDYTPTKKEVLKVNISYKNANHTVAKNETSSITFEPLQKLTVRRENKTGCLSGATLFVNTPQTDQIYQWFRNDVFFKESNSITISETGDYAVQIKGCPTTRSNKEKVIIEDTKFPAFPFSKGQNFPHCGDTAHKVINLRQLINYPLGNYAIEFLDEKSNVIDAENYTIKTGENKVITLKISNTSGCEAQENFRISYQEFPTNGKNFTSKKLCSDAQVFTTEELRHYLNLDKDFEIKFEDINGDFTLEEVNPQMKKVQFRLRKMGYDCEYQYILNFDFFEEIKVMPITPFPEHCFHSSEYFDLEKTKQELEYHPDIRATFYTDKALQEPINHLKYRGSGIIYIKIENTKTNCIAPKIVQIELKIYRKPKLVKYTPETKYSECGTEIYNLTTNIDDYLENWTKYKEIRYFDGNENRLTQQEWEHYDASEKGASPYMLFVYNETNNLECVDKIEFNLVKREKPDSKTNTIVICEENGYSLSNFKKKIGAENSVIFNENMQEITQDFVWSQLPYTVKYYLKNKNAECLSDLQTLNFIQGNPTHIKANIQDFTICDSDQDGKTTFNLNAWSNEITNDSNITLEFYTDAQRTQKINNPDSFINTLPYKQIIYGKAVKIGRCSSNFEFNLVVNTPMEIKGVDNQYVCYGDNILIKIENDFEYDDIKWFAPNDREVAIGSILSIGYEEIKFGTYRVVATDKKGCTIEKAFIISDEKQPKIKEVRQSNHQIEVIATDDVSYYEYSFNNGSWQSSNILYNPTDTSYEIKIRANGCEGMPVFVYFLKFPNAITPNGDGKNDIWKVQYLDRMENVSITIVDRYGKTVFMTNNAIEGWDGTERGRKLSTGTYWYIVKWYDKNTHRNEVRQGWILLKNQ